MPARSPVCRCWVGSKLPVWPSLRSLDLGLALSGDAGVRELVTFLLFGASCNLKSSLCRDFAFANFWDLSSLTIGDAFEELLRSVLDDLDNFLPRSFAGGESYSEEGWRGFSWKAMWGVEDWESFLSDADAGFEMLK